MCYIVNLWRLNGPRTMLEYKSYFRSLVGLYRVVNAEIPHTNRFTEPADC